MRSTTTSILFLSLLAPISVLGDAQFTSPLAGGTSSFPGGTQFTVSWADSAANLPSISSAVGDWTLALCTGGDSSTTMDCSLSSQILEQPLTGNFAPPAAVLSKRVTINKNAGPTGVFYFWRLSWNLAAGGYAINYSGRFGLTGMTGVFSATQVTANTPTWTIPAAEIHTAAAAAPAPGADALSASYSLAYTAQTGATKYAPMQQKPGSVITAKSASRKYPTSSYVLFTVLGNGKAPNAQTTHTQPLTYSFTTVINEASPAPMPQDDMQKYLNRWKD